MAFWERGIYENNFNWKQEYMIQWKLKLEECFKNRNLNLDVEIENFFKEYNDNSIILDADVVFLCVGTPEGEEGEQADDQIEEAEVIAEEVSEETESKEDFSLNSQAKRIEVLNFEKHKMKLFSKLKNLFQYSIQ